ncbi:MAG: hypothetical protein ABS85_09525 [Sphingobacteriales bacterium SCN 48-20]|uniref:hypothetical protein n=1 Tax=Terrimonas ferruginea TaxID=249 RepID=UPI00086C8D7A|nr:hypothetical protein [Terrimonas ferruginea]MBN8781469.1 hypothetical protein [Terrimonas ferruginea]ODT92454.1 MAG: hypothetical protein ABS85_09525 [Sphingobacteriales bacterium SCN 48-20]OJW44634.1 MAG: hypothetical protein BGO56_14305 [Sphingobacteriales bacterium 48-107]
MPFPPSIIFEFICLLAGVWWLLRARTGWWQLFCVFILYTLLTEITGFWMGKNKMANHDLYNVYLYIKFIFTVFVLAKLIPAYTTFWKWTGIVIFHTLFVIELINYKFSAYAFYTNVFFGTWVIVWCCIYFFSLMKQKEYVVIKGHAPFWIFTGLLFFYLCTTTASIFFKQLTFINRNYGIFLRFIIFNAASLILYAAWTYAFLCKFRKTISSSA